MRAFFFIIFSWFFITTEVYAFTERASIVNKNAIGKHRMHSVEHSVGGARNLYMIIVSGLSDGCSSLYIYADRDPFLYAAILSGLSATSDQNFSVEFHYHVDSELRGPWGDPGACKLTSFTVVR